MRGGRFEGLPPRWFDRHVRRSGSTYALLDVLGTGTMGRGRLAARASARDARAGRRDVWRCEKNGLLEPRGGSVRATGEGLALALAARLGIRPASLLILCQVYSHVKGCGLYVRSNDRLADLYGVILKDHVFQARFSELVGAGWLKKRRSATWEIPREAELVPYRDMLLGINRAMIRWRP